MRPATYSTIIAVAAVAAVAAHAHPARSTSAGGGSMKSVYEFKVRTIDGTRKSLSDFRGKTLLIVNTASECGFTPQYKSLEAVYEKYRPQGLVVLAFPANNFGQQEPGTNAEIKTFCTTKYKTTFPLFAKISVKGADMAPLYHYLTADSGFPGDIRWNFTKFLVAPDGRVAARFEPKTDPMQPEVLEKIEGVLAAKSDATR